MRHLKSAFTLIELLIVVAIIAILAAIAVPNFLEAQTRAKVSRNMADFRTATTAFETYHIDYNIYPYDGYVHIRQSTPLGFDEYNSNRISKNLTTPVSYLTTCIFPDPFLRPNPAQGWQSGNYKYWNTEATYGIKFDDVIKQTKAKHGNYDRWHREFGEYLLFAVGPDGVDPGGVNPARQWKGITDLPNLWNPYDATNGTVSVGNVLWSQRSSKGYVNAL